MLTDETDGPQMRGRLPWYRPQDLDEESLAVYRAITTGPRAHASQLSPLSDEQGRLHGPFNAMLVSPRLGAAQQATGAAIRYGTSLSATQRELAILLLAVRERSDFEWIAHVDVARQAGVTEEQIDALFDGGVVPGLAVEEAAALELVTALLESGDVGDEEYGRMEQLLGAVQIVELIGLTGYYRGLALSLRVLRVPQPDGYRRVWADAVPEQGPSDE